MKPVSKEYFDSVFPTLEEIYNHSNHQIKLWDGTGRKKYLVNTWQKEVDHYWRNNQK